MPVPACLLPRLTLKPHHGACVHRPNHQFKKSAPGPPDFAVCVCEFQEDVPDLAELEQLTLDTRPVDLKFAVVDVGTVTFYELLDLKLTMFIRL